MNTTEALRTIARTTDEALAPLEGEIARLAYTADSIKREVAKLEINGGRDYYLAARREALAKAEAKLAELDAEAAPLREIAAAGRWTRFIFVPGGHVHRFGYCSTLRPSTARQWITEYSGATEAELVEDAADAACTVCFPSAPVDRRSKVAAVVKEREEREREAAEKDAKRSKAASDAILHEDGRVAYKSLRAAENALGVELESLVSHAAYFPRVGGIAGIPETDNEETFEVQQARRARIIEEARNKARRVVAIIEANVDGYDAEAVVAKKLTAKKKQWKGAQFPADLGL